MTSMTCYSSAFVWNKNTNLHHGRFLFRHKGKKRKGKPNYPPTKPVVKAHRHMRRATHPSLRKVYREEMRQARRDWRVAVKAHNAERREKRLLEKHQNRVVVRTPREGMFAMLRGRQSVEG